MWGGGGVMGKIDFGKVAGRREKNGFAGMLIF